MLRCAGCGDLVSEFAARCPACRHTTDDAEELPEPEPDREPATEPRAQETPALAIAAEPGDPGHASTPRRRGVLFGVVAAAVVVAGAVAGFGATSRPAVRSTGASAPGTGDLAGSVVVVAADGTMLLDDPADASATPLPIGRFDVGEYPTLSASPDGRFVAASNGTVLAAGAGTLTRQASAFRVGRLFGSLVPDPFADADRALVVETGGNTIGSNTVAVVPLSRLNPILLGAGDGAAGDPHSAGAFVSVAAADPFPRQLGPYGGMADARIELRDAGKAAQVLATAAELVADAGGSGEKPVHLSLFPSPSGDKLAVVVNPVTSGDSPASIVVLDRHGVVLATVGPSAGPVEYASPSWTRDGRSLVYPTFGASGSGISVWAPGAGDPLSRAAPNPGASFGACLWAPDGSTFLCPTSDAYGQSSRWVLGPAGPGALHAERALGLPVLWLAGSVPVASPTGSVSEDTLPPLGAPTYPENLYPPAVAASLGEGSDVRACPNPSGLQVPEASALGVASSIAEAFGTSSLPADLHASDRAWWPQVVSGWHRHGAVSGLTEFPVLYAGPLLRPNPGFGVPDPAGWIASACGRTTAEDSYLVITGPRNAPALQAAWVLVERRGRLLVYYSY
ncbi:MAG: hypothetical protein ACRDYY_16940 [Acidimicrobiales bacterium]